MQTSTHRVIEENRLTRQAWLAALALSVLLLLAQSSAGQSNSLPPAHISPDGQTLLDKVIRALGGTAFLNFKTMNSRGRAFSISDGATQGFVLYQSATEFPAKRRLSYGLSKKSKAVTIINNADQGWELDRYGLIEQSPKEIRAWRLANRYSLENLLRTRVHQPGTLVQSGGEDFVDNLPVVVLDIFDAEQVEVKVDLNQATGLPIQVTYRVLNPDTHQWDDYADVYSDYQPAQGIQTPMHLVRYENGNRVAETFRIQVRYNDPYPAGYFEPPNQP